MKINADINNTGDNWIQVTLSGSRATELTEPQIEAALSATEPVAVAEIVSKHGDPEAFGERELVALVDIQNFPYRTKLYAALSAQVQDESDIVDCLSAGKPFVFDPATNFCHADDGGAPEHGIKYIPAEQVQDVAGWQPPQDCDGKEQLAFEAWAGSNRYDMHEHPLHYLFMDAKTNAARQGWKAALQYVRDQFPAAPAKQEERILHKHTNIRRGD